MAKKRVWTDKEDVYCLICFDLLKYLVPIPCGHNFCIKCIKTHWEEEEEKGIHSCPQCRKTFNPGFSEKTTPLTDVVELLKKIKLQAVLADNCHAGSEYVACDFCTGEKMKAINFCFICLAFCCENHVHSDCDDPPLKRNRGLKPYKNLQKNIRSHHDEVINFFCCTDQKFNSYLCSEDEYEHSTVSAAAERTERQRELEERRGNILHGIQDGEKDVKLLQQEVEAINHSADKTVEDSEKIFIELINLIQKRSSDVKQQIRSQQETEAAVSELRDKLQDIKRDTWTNISLTITDVEGLLLQPEPQSRAEFLKYACEITMDENSAHPELLLLEGNRKIIQVLSGLPYPSHPDRFDKCLQVLSRESLTGRCYWEVEWTDPVVTVAVAYKNVRRVDNGSQSRFGYNDRSWALDCFQNGSLFTITNGGNLGFWHNNARTPTSGSMSSRIGVYLDHSAGILSFYDVSETMTLLHRVQTTFTQPLHAGVMLHYYNDTAEFCQLK